MQQGYGGDLYPSIVCNEIICCAVSDNGFPEIDISNLFVLF